MVGGLVYWCCKRPRHDLARPPVSVTYTASESQSMMKTREAAIAADKYSALDQKTAGSQEPVGHRHMANDNDMQQAFATTLLNQLEDMGVDVWTSQEADGQAGCRPTVRNPSLNKVIHQYFWHISLHFKFSQLLIPLLLIFQNYISSHIVNVECFYVYILCNIIFNINFELIKNSLLIIFV